MKNKKIAVVMGGPSSEREVSLRTGAAIVAALTAKGYNVQGLDLDPAQFITQLREGQYDIVFNAVHGKYGEDGVLQGALELAGIPYTGSGVLASAAAMDKILSKRLFAADGIPTPRFAFFAKKEQLSAVCEQIQASFGCPVVIKSAAQGSSIGVTIVEAPEQLVAAVEDAFRYSEVLLAEEYISGREVTVAVWGAEQPEALPIIEIVPHSGRYDYHSKYTSGATEYIVPAPLNDEVAAAVQAAAVRAFQVLGCTGIARADVMLDRTGSPYVLEVNTIPGMTATSLVPKAAAAAGISFEDLCERILLMATQA